jgi:hypothetical protein
MRYSVGQTTSKRLYEIDVPLRSDRATSYKGCRRSTTEVTDETVRTDETVTEASD